MKTTFKKGTENKFYVGLIITVSILLVVFFTSKLWMYDDEPIMQTPFNTTITGLDQTALKLNKWEYNPEKELMEVTIETEHTGSDIVKPTFTFSARERNEVSEYPVKVVYKDDTNIVVQIKNVPKTYRVMGLIIKEHRDQKILESELKEHLVDAEGSLDQEENEQKIQLPKPAEKILVGDYRKIKINSELKTRDAIDYQIENIEREIKQIEDQIKTIIEEEIPLQDELIVSLQQDIEAIEVELEYKTDEEKEQALGEIQSKDRAIENAKKVQKELQTEVEKLAEKHQKLQEKLQDIQRNGKEENKNIEEQDKQETSEAKDKNDKETDKK